MSELVDRARTAPQEITVHGKPVAVVVSRATFDALSQARGSLLEFMQQSPLHEADDVKFERDKSRTRKVRL
jgi:prevent-host-death family protein